MDAVTRMALCDYYHTGDVASRDADGYITYIGRTDDVFKASDYKISPFELGKRAHRAPGGGVEAAVVPAPDPNPVGAVPKAYISLAAGWAPDRATADAIFAHARRNLRPINVSGALNSWIYRRPTPARFDVSSCALRGENACRTRRF